jgi:2-succinyl-5-enolpyruvyl-6-hydroxy-3-cyclohexene-1-carboxylate synthase
VKNRSLATAALNLLAKLGVMEVCVCAGRRDAPLIQILEKQRGFRVHSFFEERSAAFFALGCAKRTGRPGAIVTTSGTAVAELLPAFIEAHYSGYSLIAVTADRPRRLRGTGAPQTIDQVGIFGSYVAQCIDREVGEELPHDILLDRGSLHLNLAFDEPLNEGEPPTLDFDVAAGESPRSLETTVLTEKLTRFLAGGTSPLVVVGPVKATAREGVERFVRALKAPTLVEGASGLRGAPSLQDIELVGGNNFLQKLLSAGTFDRIVRVGGVPSARVWRDLDEKFSSLPVLHITDTVFPGLGRGDVVTVALEGLPARHMPEWGATSANVSVHDRRAGAALVECIESEPTSEVALVRALSERIAAEAAVYLGNSLPIREWDLGAVREKMWRAVEANRGANGIDGQLSTFFGWSLEATERWCILGDLTTLYDLSAPSCAPESGKIRIVIVNNGGGQIFRRMFSEKLFRNEHSVSFEGWASMWGFAYLRVDGAPVPADLPDRVVIEIRPDQAASDRMWARYDSLSMTR